MKSVMKAVAPIAMTITFAISGVAMADTAHEAAKSADAASTTVKETAAPTLHKHHEASKQTAKQAEQTVSKEAAAPASAEKIAQSKPAVEKVAAEKAPAEKAASTAAGATEKAQAKVEPGKVESGKNVESTKAVEPTKTK